MLGRLGFIGRLIGIVLLLILVLVGINTAFLLISEERKQTPSSRFPLPDQAAAIVELIESAPLKKRAEVQRAVSTPRFQVRIVPKVPDALLDKPRMAGIEWLIGQYLETFRDRAVLAVRVGAAGRGPIGRFFDRMSPINPTSVNVAVALRDGHYVLFEVKHASPLRLFGVPAGFWFGVLGCAFSALALWAISREARPLRELVRSVQGFSGDGTPRPVDVRGAPEIRKLIEASNQMEERISALLRGRTILLGAVSHDLKTYLTRLRLRVEAIKDPAQRDRAIGELDDMTRLIDDSIDIARGGAEAPQREMVNLVDLIEDDLSLRDAPGVVVLAGTGPHKVFGDRVGLQRLFGNLIDNALRYGTSVQVHVVRDGDLLRVMIDDDGPGIAESDRHAVFEPYYRLEPSRNRGTGGSGLGLAIVKQIAEAHQGRVSIDVSPSGGARFTVILPARQTVPPSQDRAGSAGPS
jgi:two-component system, OmpR family, osmolarity sensor histidine kinase EnvZ